MKRYFAAIISVATFALPLAETVRAADDGPSLLNLDSPVGRAPAPLSILPATPVDRGSDVEPVYVTPERPPVSPDRSDSKRQRPEVQSAPGRRPQDLQNGQRDIQTDQANLKSSRRRYAPQQPAVENDVPELWQEPPPVPRSRVGQIHENREKLSPSSVESEKAQQQVAAQNKTKKKPLANLLSKLSKNKPGGKSRQE